MWQSQLSFITTPALGGAPRRAQARFAKCGNATLFQRVCLAKLCQYREICNAIRRSPLGVHSPCAAGYIKKCCSLLAFSLLNKERKQRARRAEWVRERERSLRFNSCMNTAAQQSRAARLQNRGRTSTPRAARERARADTSQVSTTRRRSLLYTRATIVPQIMSSKN